MAQKTWEITLKIHHFASIFIVALAAATAALYLAQDITTRNYFTVVETSALGEDKKSDSDISNPSPKCNLYTGNWVYDNASHPPYEEKQCTFMQDSLACEKYGRKDFKFNGTAFLEKLRGKKLMVVGDSIGRNLFVSMLCLIESSLPTSKEKRVVETAQNVFHFKEYNATIGDYWSPYLVESNCDDKFKGKVVERVVRINGIERHARNWDNADILVFNTYLWWLYPPNITILWSSFDSQESINKTVEIKPRYYEMALNTLSDWLEVNVDRSKTRVFFMSATPYIFRHEKSRSCYNVSEPTFVSDGYFSTSRMDLMDIADEAMKKLGKRGIKVEYLRISEMSAQRRDAHPSIYRKFDQPVSEEERRDPKSYSDCIHWCVPGVPDVWNRMLYAHIMKS